MEAAEREALVGRLARAFGAAADVTAGGQPPHILLPKITLPSPWQPSPARAMTVWANWPAERPQFLVDEGVVGETGEPPRSNSAVYVAGDTWRGFSFSFAWSGDDPVRAVQLWMQRFTAERS